MLVEMEFGKRYAQFSPQNVASLGSIKARRHPGCLEFACTHCFKVKLSETNKAARSLRVVLRTVAYR
jgi:hypothetical protein